jgi:hypothetical protein
MSDHDSYSDCAQGKNLNSTGCGERQTDRGPAVIRRDARDQKSKPPRGVY